ncbi:MAG: sterol desaturase family protein [Ilumatobacter sp.]
MSISFALIAVVAFVVMEPVTAATHRWVMHGIGEFLHRSHHRPRSERFEANDWYPVIFASIVIIGFVAGFRWDTFTVLVPVGIGVTAYGAAYALVHDVYIHGRLGWRPRRPVPALEQLAEAHRVHHLYNAAPYGMLVPVVPAELRDRAQRTDRNPLARA